MNKTTQYKALQVAIRNADLHGTTDEQTAARRTMSRYLRGGENDPVGLGLTGLANLTR